MDVSLRTLQQAFCHFAAICLVVVCAARAQPPPPPPAGEPAAEAPPRRDVVADSDLKIFWLRSKTGGLVPVPDLTVEEFVRLSLLQDPSFPADAAPEIYAFQGDIGFTGTASADEAEFTVQLNVRVRETADSNSNPWIRIPLRLNQAILLPGIKHVGQGDFLPSYQKQGDGYVAWLRAAPNSDHAITMKIKVKVVRTAGRFRVSLLTPQTPTKLQLEVPGSDLDVTTNNLEENILTSRPVGNQKTRISVENVGGLLEITWREKNLSAPVLESTGTTRATINGQQIDYETNLRVRSYGAPIRTFDVRLPADAIWIPESTPGVRVEVLAEPEQTSRLVRVTREDGKEEPALEVRLKAFSPNKVLTDQTEVSGFAVVDAVRQTGSLDLAVVGDWTVDWFPGSYVRQVAVSEPQRQGGVVARFEYDRQPYSLKVEVRQREPRVRVAPTYSLFVEATQIRLIGNLKYSASGARIRELELQAEGWTIDRVLPADLIGQTIALTKTTPLKIPLVPNGKPLAEDFEIRIEAHHPISADENSFSVGLPRTVSGVAAPATVAVYPADNIDLTQRAEEIKNLIPESQPPDLAAPKTRQPAIFFVEESSEGGMVFAGDFKVRSRVVAANVENTLRFSANALAVEQRFDLEISYEPLRQFRFIVPEAMVPTDRIQFFELVSETAAANGGLRERPLPVMEIAPAEVPGLVAVTVDLLADRIAPCSIAARYAVPITKPAGGDPRSLELIRVAPDPSVTVGTSKLRLVSAEDVDVELVSEGWDTLIDDLLDPSSREQLFQTSGDVAQVEVVARLVQSPQLGATVLEKFWLQTQLSRLIRQDRACFQLRTNSERIQVQLPAGAELLAVAVEGLKQPDATASPSGVVAIDLDPRAAAGTHTVDVWYTFVAKDVPVARLSVEPPILVGVRHARRNYWQLILPRDEHLLIPPSSLTPEYTWRWNSNHWGRDSNRRQADLEATMNASRVESPLDGAVNQYLFTSVGPILPVEFITASRGSLTLMASLTVLATGLCLIYFSWARHPASLLILGVAVMALGFAFPEPAILAAQAAALGMTFVLLARILHHNASRRRGTAVASTGSSVSLADSKNGFTVQLVPEGNSHSTTTLAPASYQVPIVEPKT